MNWINERMVFMARDLRRRWAIHKSAHPKSKLKWNDAVKRVLEENGFVTLPVYIGMLNDECKRQRKENEKRQSVVKDEFPPYTNKRTRRRRFR
jgi:hypothetical protein